MVKTIKIATRFLVKHKGYTAINVFGLSLSFVSVLFIALYIYDEVSFDRFHSNTGRIYRVIEYETSAEGTSSKLADVPFMVAQLDDQLVEIENKFRLTMFGRANFLADENDIKIYEAFFVSEQGFIDMFDFKVLYGSRDHALTEPNTIVLTRSTAERLFGQANAVGKIIRSDRSDQPLRVSAVLADFPANSHLNVNLLVSLPTFANDNWYKQSLSDWSGNFFSTYLLLREGSSARALEMSMTKLVNQNRSDEIPKTSFTLQRLKDVHFHSADIRGGYANNPGEIYYLYIFGAVGIFIILISSINYVNLSTSLSITRGKEIGVKKVAGAGRGNLMIQFIAESNIISFSALLISLFVLNLVLPSFNAFVGKQISMNFFLRPDVLTCLFGFTLLIGMVSGCYPALYLSRFRPALALKGFSAGKGKSSTLRQTLVVFQFALSIILILATLVAQQQLSFIQNKNLGFNDEQLVVLDINSGAVRRGFDVIKNEISKIPGVRSVSVSSRVPGEWKNLPQVGVALPGKEHPRNLFFMGVDDDFLATFEIKLLTGRNFSEGNMADSSAFLINETAARELGLLDPLAENIKIETVNFASNENRLDHPVPGRIIGVVKDFHFQSLHQKIGPLLIAFRNNPIHSIDYFSVRLSPGDWQQAIKDMEKALHMVDPAQLIEYNFLDQRLADFYRQDVKRSRLFTIAATVSVGLACLGLFSLVSFMTEQRTKEIGIRKALGATIPQIVGMLSGSYLKLVLIGFIVATPVAVWALNKWLQSFAYKIDIGWLTITGALIISILIAFTTVGYKSIRAALENPVKSLRSE